MTTSIGVIALYWTSVWRVDRAFAELQPRAQGWNAGLFLFDEEARVEIYEPIQCWLGRHRLETIPIDLAPDTLSEVAEPDLGR